MKNESGLAAVWVILIAVIALALGAGGVWYWQQSQEPEETTPTATTQPTTTPTTTPTTSSSDESTSLLDGKIHITMPDGWSKISEFQATITLNGRKYIAGFQLNDDEYLKKGGAYARNLITLKTTKTAKGTPVYIIRDGDNPNLANAMVSSCKPAIDSACSIKYGNQLLHILLSDQTEGFQAVDPVDFSRTESDRVLTDFISMAESLDI